MEDLFFFFWSSRPIAEQRGLVEQGLFLNTLWFEMFHSDREKSDRIYREFGGDPSEMMVVDNYARQVRLWQHILITNLASPVSRRYERTRPSLVSFLVRAFDY